MEPKDETFIAMILAVKPKDHTKWAEYRLVKRKPTKRKSKAKAVCR
jgi:hypothetical protein